jgi:hypothetical protein
MVIGGGTWAAFLLTHDDSPPGTGNTPLSSPYPYGRQVGLTAPLRAGDCVKAVWSAGESFKSRPNLGVVDCAEDYPAGQVVAVDTAADYEDARKYGAKRCAQQARPIAAALPDAGHYAVVPTERGFEKAGGGTACLVLGRHAPIRGEVGRFRDAGTDLWVAQMGIEDCFDWTEDEAAETYSTPLTDCSEPHTDQVIGFVRPPENLEYQKGFDSATDLCSNKFESTWAAGEKLTIFGWPSGKDDWNEGFTTIVCTVGSADTDERTTGRISAAGAV